jgi:prepilin-type N-terminal cleavage/methylation domain-containing protein
MFTPWEFLSGGGQDRGFTVVELLLVILIVGVLAAIGAPLYLGYAVDAKMAEGKMMAGGLWTAVQTSAIGFCGTDIPVNNGYPRVGLTNTGQTTPDRWSVSAGGANTLSADCRSGQYTASASPLFVIKGDSGDVNGLRVQFMYSPTGTPPSQLQCSKDGGTTFIDC